MPAVDATPIFNSLVQDLTFGGTSLPFIGQATLGIIRVRYWFWWCSSRKKMVMQSNAGELGFGLLLNFSIRNEKARAAFKVFLLIIRIEKCVGQFKLFMRECDQLGRAIRGEYMQADVKWINGKNAGLFSPAYAQELNDFYSKFNRYVSNVASCAYRILLRLDKLLMHSIDAHEALLADNEAVITSIIHGSEVLRRVFENREELYQILETRKPMIEKCLSLFVSGNSKEKTDQLMLALKDTLGQGHELYQSYQSASSAIGVTGRELAVDFGKRMLFGVAHLVCMTRFIPKEFIPEPDHIVRARLHTNHLAQYPSVSDIKGKLNYGSATIT